MTWGKCQTTLLPSSSIVNHQRFDWLVSSDLSVTSARSKRKCWTYSGLSPFAGETRRVLLRDTLSGLCYAFSAFEFFSLVDSRTISIYGNSEGIDQSRRHWYRSRGWTHLGPKLAVGYKTNGRSNSGTWGENTTTHRRCVFSPAREDKSTAIYVLKWDKKDLVTSGMYRLVATPSVKLTLERQGWQKIHLSRGGI